MASNMSVFDKCTIDFVVTTHGSTNVVRSLLSLELEVPIDTGGVGEHPLRETSIQDFVR